MSKIWKYGKLNRDDPNSGTYFYMKIGGGDDLDPDIKGSSMGRSDKDTDRILMCPHCERKNRAGNLPVDRYRCGHCKTPLVHLH